MWDLFTLAKHCADALETAEKQTQLEQAVYGIDKLDEKRLQSLLADALAEHYGVYREVHYPSSVGARLSARKRCDLVLAPLGRALLIEHAEPSLFDPPNPCKPEEALWVELKVAHQFRELGVPHGGYGAQWRDAVVSDLQKMEADVRINEAALLLVVFTESEAVVEKDLELFENVLMQKEVLAGFRRARTIRVSDRMGHTCCTVAIWPTVQRNPDAGEQHEPAEK